eukprot:2616083-Amphidinium_carterae.1
MGSRIQNFSVFGQTPQQRHGRAVPGEPIKGLKAYCYFGGPQACYPPLHSPKTNLKPKTEGQQSN